MFIDGYLGQLVPVVGGGYAEMATAGYARQPVSFARPASGMSLMSSAFNFGAASSAGTLYGRAIYDAPSGGNLLLLLPCASPRVLGGPFYEGRGVGGIVLMFDLLAGLANGDAFTGLLNASTVVGKCYDVTDVLGTFNAADVVPPGATALPLPGGLFRYVNLSPMTTGPGQLVINRGVLQLRATAQGVA